MTEQSIMDLEVNLGDFKEIAINLTDKTAYDRYIDESKCTQTNEYEFSQQFNKEVNFFDEKNSAYLHPNARLLGGINLDYFYSVLITEVFPIVPDKCNLNMKAVINDFEMILEANKNEVQRARVNRKAKNPTDFIRTISDMLCLNIITDQAIKYSINENTNKI